MAGGSDLQPSKSAKNAATCKKRQGADIKKKKQSCDINETSHEEKKIDDKSGKKEDDKDSKVVIKKEDGNSNSGATINTEEEVLKKNYDKLSEVSVNRNKEDCNIKGAVNIKEGGKCNYVNFDKGILNKNDVHNSKDALSKETDTFKKAEDALNNDNGIKIMGATKNKEQDICNNNNNIESHKTDNDVKAASARDKQDVKKATETSEKEDCISASSGDKDSPNNSSPKKKPFFYNNRGRRSYGNNRGRNFNWRGGWGYNNYNRYQHRRMMNSGPSSAYRGNDHLRSNYSESARGQMNTSSPFHPEAPPHAFIGSLQPEAYYQESLDVAGAHTNVGETEVPAYKPYAGDVSLSTAMEAVSQEKYKAETNEKKDLDHHTPPGSQESRQTEASQFQEGHGIASNIIASVSSNPLFELGKCAEHDQQLVHSFAGIEMRPSIQLPPDYGLQWFFIPYGAALPPSVIPVMVVPFINPAADNVYQARQDANGGRDQGFPPPQNLLPSYFNNVDFQTPFPVDTLQPAVHAWPNQVMAPMTAGNPAQYVYPQNHSSQTEIHAENKFKAK